MWQRIAAWVLGSWKKILQIVGILILTLVILQFWQTRHLLSAKGSLKAPAFTLTGLDGKQHALADSAGKKTILYFIAPWCGVCHQSVGNLQAIIEKNPGRLTAYIIALAYENVESVKEFAEGKNLSMPVLLGDDRLGEHYQINSFPTYYVINDEGYIVSRNAGYSTWLGLWLRTR